MENDLASNRPASPSSIMRFQRTVDEKRFVFEQELEPCSMYILSGSARFHWEHSIPKVKGTRYSITFRTLKE
jgi:DNA oxidative demethylase